MMTTTRPLLTDPANLITYVGLVLGSIGIYAALNLEFEASILFLLAAFIADRIDGPVARQTAGRSKIAAALGGILDSGADVICHSVAPALILLCYCGLALYLLPVAVFFILAGTIRMARNTVEGGYSPTTFRGLNSDNNIVILAMVFLIEPLLRGEAFANLLALVLVVTGLFNLSTIPVPKVVGRGNYAMTAWTLAIGVWYGTRLGIGR